MVLKGVGLGTECLGYSVLKEVIRQDGFFLRA